MTAPARRLVADSAAGGRPRDMTYGALEIALDGGRDVVTLVRGAEAPPGYAVDRTLLALPGPDNPQVLLEHDQAGGTAASLRRFSLSRSWHARTVATVASAALRTGLPFRLALNRSISVCRRCDSEGPFLPDMLGTLLGAPQVRLAVRTGGPRPNRKPVLQVSDGRGDVLAFVKVGWNELTRRLVRQEAAALEAIAALPRPPRSFAVPRVVWAGTWKSVEVLVLEPLPEPAVRRRPVTRPPLSVSRAIGGLHGASDHTLADSPYWLRLARRVDDLDNTARSVRRARDQLERRAGSTRLRCGTWHGDWTAGNIAPTPGRLLVFDWERSGTGVPLGLDAAYFVVHGASSRTRWRGLAHARSALHGMLFDLDSNHHAAWLLVDLALLEMTVRFHEARLHDMDVDGSVFESILERSLEEHGG